MPSSGSILGIDLRVTSVKVVEVEKKDSGFTLKNWGMTEVPYQLMDKHPQIEDAKAEALVKILRANKIRSRDAVAVVAGGDTLVKLFTLSVLPYNEIAEAIKWKFAEEISYPIDDAIIDFYPVREAEVFTEKVDYVAVCINRKLYLETQYILNRAGIRLQGITVLPDALQELYKSEITKDGDKITSIIYQGKRTTNISIFRRGNFEFNRELNIGGENITLAMSGILVSPEGRVEISPEEAEKIKLEYGVPVDLGNFPKVGEIPMVQLQAMVRPALEKIQGEIKRTFEYYSGQTGEAAVSKVILTGGTSQTQHLLEFLSQGLGVPVLTPEPLPQLNPRLTGALGAALTGARRLNLMPESVKHRWKIAAQKVFKPIVLLPVFIGSLAIIYAYYWLQAFSLQTEIDSINRKLEEYKPRLAQLDVIQMAYQTEEKKRQILKSYEEKRTKMPMIFEEISRIIPESAHINTMNLTPGSLHLFGTVFKKGDAAENILSRFVLGLSASTFFEEVQMVQATKNNDNLTEAFNFEIIAAVKVK